jgi:hypothetical protein
MPPIFLQVGDVPADVLPRRPSYGIFLAGSRRGCIAVELTSKKFEACAARNMFLASSASPSLR